MNTAAVFGPMMKVNPSMKIHLKDFFQIGGIMGGTSVAWTLAEAEMVARLVFIIIGTLLLIAKGVLMLKGCATCDKWKELGK